VDSLTWSRLRRVSGNTEQNCGQIFVKVFGEVGISGKKQSFMDKGDPDLVFILLYSIYLVSVICQMSARYFNKSNNIDKPDFTTVKHLHNKTWYLKIYELPEYANIR